MPKKIPATERELLSSADVSRTIARIAHEIIEHNPHTPVTLIGIPTRGIFLSRKLGLAIAKISGTSPAIGTIDVTMYRDDLGHQPHRPLGKTDIPSAGIEETTVVLVDDVLYTGRTVRAAIESLFDIGRPKAIQLAVLVDRGHRELPIRADYVGKNIPSARSETVSVLCKEIDHRDAVVLSSGGQAS